MTLQQRLERLECYLQAKKEPAIELAKLSGEDGEPRAALVYRNKNGDEQRKIIGIDPNRI